MYTVLNRDFVYNGISAVYFTNTCIFDNRGFFTVGFNKDAFNSEINSTFEVVQHNISCSEKNIARGLHFQIENNQAKVVHCIKGKVVDIIVDLRINSPFFGKGKAYMLDSVNTYLYVPHGFAHGFVTLEDNSLFEYFVDNTWNKNSEYVLHMTDYFNNNNIYLVNSKNEIHPYTLNNKELNFSAKDFTLAKNYILDDESINEFKELVKNNKDFI